MTLDLDASDKLLAYFPRTDDAKEASLMIPREKIPCPLACVLGFAASEREERLERLPIIEGVTMRMVWNADSNFSSSFKQPWRKLLISLCIVTLAATSTECNAEEGVG